MDMTPTALVPLDFNAVAVAGVDRWGGTHIRTYILDNVITQTNKLQDGDVSVNELFFSSPFDPQTHVYRMWRSPANSQEVFVLFWNTRSLQKLDVLTDTRTVVAQPSGTGPFVTMPELDRNIDFVWAREHVNYGYLYFFYDSELPGLPVLQDADKDGTPESYFVIQDAQDWITRGLEDAALYVE